MSDARELLILIVEDDEGHATLIRRGLRDAGVCNRMLRFANGEDVWNFVSGRQHPAEGEPFDPGKSYLMLLDINMPRLDGIEVLKRIKGDAALKEMPVIMLTTTDDPREVRECYQLGCNVYMTKPVGFLAFAEALKRLGLFLQVIKVGCGDPI